MRAIGLLLIIVNLGYFGWATLVDVQDKPTASPSTAPDADVQRLILAAERSVATAAAAEHSQKSRADRAAAAASADSKRSTTGAATNSQSEQVEAMTGGSKCISIGPFQDLTSAAQASATLKSAGRESRQRLEQGQLWVGYWVSVPGFGKREDAERAVTRLKQNGITDVYISLSGAEPESSNVVSLGVFKDSERAQRLLAEAKSLGFPAQISDRTRAGSVYWVDADFPAPQPNFDFSTLGAQPGKILRLEQRSCPGSTK